MADEGSGDARRSYSMSRLLRLGLFSLVAAALLVSLFVVTFKFVWDRFLREAFGNQAPYQARVELLLPAMILIALFLGVGLWKSAQKADGPAK